MRRPLAVLLAGLLAAAMALAQELPPPEATAAATPRCRVLVIGVDGLEWSILLPLLNAGELPHLAGLIEHGTFGRLATSAPTVSPIIWTTIATGKPPREHGILSFTYYTKKRQIRLFTSHQRRVKAIWNILSEHGRSVDVTGWWITWPAEPVRGHMVSQYSSLAQLETRTKGSVQEGVAAQTHPPEYLAEILPGVREVVQRFAWPEAGDEGEVPPAVREILGTELRPGTWTELERRLFEDSIWAFQADETYAGIACRGLGHGADLTMVYLGAPDVAGHRFMRYYRPEAFEHPPSAASLQAFAEVLPDAYRHLDSLIGRLLAACAEDVGVLVLSDHGMVPFNQQRDLDRLYRGPEQGLGAVNSGHHKAREPGALIAARGPFQASGRVPAKQPLGPDDLPVLGNIFEVTPTLLYLMNLPLAADMRGGVMQSLFPAGQLEREPMRQIATYEGTATRAGSDEFEGLDAERLEQLRGLGYIDGGGAKKPPKNADKKKPGGGK